MRASKSSRSQNFVCLAMSFAKCAMQAAGMASAVISALRTRLEIRFSLGRWIMSNTKKLAILLTTTIFAPAIPVEAAPATIGRRIARRQQCRTEIVQRPMANRQSYRSFSYEPGNGVESSYRSFSYKPVDGVQSYRSDSFQPSVSQRRVSSQRKRNRMNPAYVRQHPGSRRY